MAQYIDKDALVAWAKETYLCENASMVRKVCYKQLLEHLNTLEVKEVDLNKEKIENIKKQCPFREVVCSKYQNHPLKCSGACAFVSDRITLEKKHLHDIQNIPVDEERLKMDRRNTV